MIKQFSKIFFELKKKNKMKDMRPMCFLCYGVLYKNTGLDDHHSLKLDLVSKNILNYSAY